ncbi:hypothetical protein J31TS4_28910 [Paenibacillus sp. J31TS4]|uniref:sporulation protein YqfC n=1 Tax=Paenibacillus sp. J31TS4 TaxID=2807195 RepID=UPI001B047058|nr:sporulation protein YqfC [Paenibacillus sp. J31TS4]GIP39611.1 hypothetical protein J31TS4_28910 [Paenibacillus sp. J31TS4]
MGRLKKRLHSLTAKMLDVPQDVTLDLPRLTMIGDRQLYIENHRGVLQFTSELLRLSLSKGELEVRGRDLVMRAILPDEVFIEGVIAGIQLLHNE